MGVFFIGLFKGGTYEIKRRPERRIGSPSSPFRRGRKGGAGRDAALVLLVNRPEVYNPDDHPGEAEIIVAKHRNGRTGSVWLEFEGDFARFSDPPSGGGF